MAKDSNAGGSIAGFVYQIYYFLYRLVTIQKEEIVSLEKIDDVGSETGESRTYYQLKHTLNTKPSAVKRMADRDTDLWKTLNLWVDIIKKQGDEDAQRNWIAQSEFVLISNKTTDNNLFFVLVDAYQNKGKWDQLSEYLASQAAKEPKVKKEERKSDKKNIYYYTKNVNEFALKKEFLEKVKVEFETDEDIKARIDHVLTFQKYVPAGHAENLRQLLMGNIADAIDKKEVEFTDESFNRAFGTLFQKMRTRKFVPTPRNFVIPERPMEQTFVKQLRDIDAPRSKTLKDVIELTEQKMGFENDYNHANTVAGAEDQKDFEIDVKNRWKNAFEEMNADITVLSSNDEINKAGREVLKAVKKEALRYDEYNLDSVSSNGCFYFFSDGESPRIGWRQDWMSKYHGQEWTKE